MTTATKSNYAIKPTPEQALGTNRTMPPARLIAALELMGETVEGLMSENVRVLLDSLSLLSGRVPGRFLGQKEFPWFANLPEVLSVPDEDLDEWLQKLSRDGIVLETACGDEKCYEIGKVGRDLWDSWYTPRWDLFVNPSSPSSFGNAEIVLCLDESLGREYLRVAVRSGLFSRVGEIEHKLLDCSLLAPQLVKANVHQFTFYQPESNSGPTGDWGEYEKHRVWWSSVMELRKSIWARR